jgi:hypothetical protein
MTCESWITPALDGREETAREFASELNGVGRAGLEAAERRPSPHERDDIPRVLRLRICARVLPRKQGFRLGRPELGGLRRRVRSRVRRDVHKITGLKICDPIPSAELLTIYSELECR